MAICDLDREALDTPRADDSERCVIGAILLSADARDEIAGMVRAADFFDERCAVLFRAIMEVHATARQVDMVLVCDWLRTRKLLEAAGGAKFISETFSTVPTAAHAAHYAKRVSDASTLRAVMLAANKIASDAADNQHDAPGVVERAQQRLGELLDRTATSEPKSIGDVLQTALAAIEDRCDNPDQSEAIGTGINELNRAMAGGLRKNQLVVIAARPGVGKSALALQIVHEAARSGHVVLLSSLEMGRDELAERMLTQHALVDGNRLRDGSLNGDERRRVVACAAEQSRLPLFVEDRPNQSVRDIASAARRLRRKQGSLGMILIDYIQLVTVADHRVPRQEQVAQIARSLKMLAKELEIPVVCLCQLNRDSEKQNRAPRMSDLRESGSIEQDGDVVLLLHRAEQSRKDENDGKLPEIEVIIEKQRSGPRGTHKLLWSAKHCKFAELAGEKFKEFTGWSSEAGDDVDMSI